MKEVLHARSAGDAQNLEREGVCTADSVLHRRSMVVDRRLWAYELQMCLAHAINYAAFFSMSPTWGGGRHEKRRTECIWRSNVGRSTEELPLYIKCPTQRSATRHPLDGGSSRQMYIDTSGP